MGTGYHKDSFWNHFDEMWDHHFCLTSNGYYPQTLIMILKLERFLMYAKCHRNCEKVWSIAGSNWWVCFLYAYRITYYLLDVDMWIRGKVASGVFVQNEDTPSTLPSRNSHSKWLYTIPLCNILVWLWWYKHTAAIDIFIALRSKNQLHLSLDFISHGKGVPCERNIPSLRPLSQRVHVCVSVHMTFNWI